MSRLTGSQMRYLHVIFKAQKDETNIRSVDISRELGVTKASVSRMIKLLEGMGLISVKEHGKVMLTSKGRLEGAVINDRVTRIYPFFADYLELLLRQLNIGTSFRLKFQTTASVPPRRLSSLRHRPFLVF